MIKYYFGRTYVDMVKTKTPKQRGRKTKVISITVPIELIPQIQRQAAEAGRNVSNYLSWLATKDFKS